MSIRKSNIWKSVDWVTIIIYLILVVCGWLSVCGASYDYGEPDFLDFSTRAGKQFVWIICSLGIAFVLLMLDDDLYDIFSYLVYIGMILLLVLTILIAPDVKGSRSWIQLGPVSLQPAEFAKFATALALAKYMSSSSFSMYKIKSAFIAVAFIMLPMVLIILQKETGSALVYAAFFLMLYREGMPGVVLFSGICAVVYFVVGIRYDEVPLFEESTTMVGKFVVLYLILLVAGGMLWTTFSKWTIAHTVLIGSTLLTVSGYLISKYVFDFNLLYLLWGGLVALTIYMIYLSLKRNSLKYIGVALFALCSAAFLYSSDYVFDEILEQHQRMRIKVVLGLEEDLAGAGYNVNQSKIAIGSGGAWGKGFLNGTQTKLKYVPEQDTDFIFCTIGEEQGFVGSVFVLLGFLLLILRLIYLSEQQRGTFGRVYGYSVVSILLFHFFINIGMVLGLTPVIGIPLPFFSYGGSALWSFTILLFIFLRLDASRNR